MDKRYYPLPDETLYQAKLSNGLTVMVCPKPGFTRKVAYFVTDFGAIHTEFTLDGVHHTVPAGVAHFLEHKMFELPGRDVSEEFARLGTAVNAFTSYDLTAYYVSCTENFPESLRLLLEFVSTPYFTEESVQREMGIIDQEIGMNLDDPGTQGFEQLMQAMFQKHPIRVPILGSSDSIRQITPEILHLCHRAFYTPANMTLCVVGDVDPDFVCQTALAVLGDEARPVGIKAPEVLEDMICPQKQVVKEMDIPMPQFTLGFQCEPTGMGEEAIRREFVADLAAEALFGESSQLYLQLYEQGLIDSSFGGGFETSDGCAMLTLGGDSYRAQEILPRILEAAGQIVEQGIEPSDLLRMKRSALGRRIRDLDSFDSTCFRLCAYYLSGYDYFRFPGLYEAIELRELQEFLARVIRPERSVLSIINPLKEEPYES